MMELLFGTKVSHGGSARAFGADLLKRLANSGLEELEDDDLVFLVEFLLTNLQLRVPLRGNVRFLSSVTTQYRRKGVLSPKQRRGVLNILQKAYPHNLAAEIGRFS